MVAPGREAASHLKPWSIRFYCTAVYCTYGKTNIITYLVLM